MSNSILPENEPQIQPRNPYPFARPGAIPDGRLEALFEERPTSLVARADSASTSASPSTSTSCGPNDTAGACEKYYNSGSSTTVPIVLGVVIPLGIAFAVLIFLHRRHVRKLRKEDADDKHKSLDFGLDEGQAKGRKKDRRNQPQMSMAENKEMGGTRRERGLSMDLGTHNPYLLPPGLNQSRESLHSLSRSINTGDDKYRTTTFIPDDGSVRSPSSLRSPVDDSSSTFTGSSSRRFNYDSKHNLLHNAQDNPTGPPPRRASKSPGRDTSVDPVLGSRKPLPSSNNNLLAPASTDPARDSFVSTTSSSGGVNALRASNNYLGQFISGGVSADKDEAGKKTATASVTEVKPDPPVDQVRAPPTAVIKEDLRYRQASAAPSINQEAASATPSITLNVPEDRQPRLPQLSFIDSQGNKQSSLEEEFSTNLTTTLSDNSPQQSAAPSTDPSHQEHFSQQNQPPSHDNKDQYYEEDDYYDEEETYGDHYHAYEDQHGYDSRRLTMGMRPLPPDDPSENPEDRANRIRSFYKEYFDDSKPHQHAQNAGYYDGSEGYYENYGPDAYYDQVQYPSPRGHSQAGGYGRHRATVSNGSYMSGPRAFSTASGRYGHPPSRMPPKKRLPPPKALNVLPTPHLLKDDTFLPIDFAPPKKFQNQRAGTPDSARGGERPYSPSIRAHVPLASSFDDLAMIPSPHQLRKSSTFTALDFAPPQFRPTDTMSDTGSIRSNRSGISALHAQNIRTGAYRVSRIPKEVAGTRNELAQALKPQWDLNR